MKLKYYLRGLGTGILITTLILFVAYSYRETTEKNEEKDTTGKTVEQNDSSSTTGESSSPEDDEITDESSSSEENSSADESSSQEETTPEETTTSEPETPEETTTAPPVVNDTNTTVEFTIYSGYSSYDVAIILEQTGVVESAADFDNYLGVNGYDYRISTGTYTVTVGDSYETIAELITY